MTQAHTQIFVHICLKFKLYLFTRNSCFFSSSFALNGTTCNSVLLFGIMTIKESEILEIISSEELSNHPEYTMVQEESELNHPPSTDGPGSTSVCYCVLNCIHAGGCRLHNFIYVYRTMTVKCYSVLFSQGQVSGRFTPQLLFLVILRTAA